MPNTHCLPSGSLGTAQIPVPPFTGYPGTILTPSGSKRGVVVWSPGLGTLNTSWGQSFADNGVFQVQTLATNLQNDGWVVIYAEPPGLNYLTTQATGVFNDINNDAGNGSRFKTTASLWWDHVINYLNLNYPGWPVVPFGGSMGGLFTLIIATTRTSTIAAYGMQVPAELLWTAQLTGVNYAQSPVTAALDSSMNGLAWPQSTVTANASIAAFPSSGCIMVAQSGGVTGFSAIRYTGKSGNSFTGCTGGYTGATMATGGTIQQSSFTSGLDISMTALNALGNGSQGSVPVGYMAWETLDSLIGFANTQTLYNNANGAGTPVTHRAGPNDHQMLYNDVSFITANTWVSGGTYVVNQIVVNSAVSYICILNVSGSSTAPGSDATHWSAISGGNTTQGWFQTTVDPLCPAVH
jgi:hypothetical protein